MGGCFPEMETRDGWKSREEEKKRRKRVRVTITVCSPESATVPILHPMYCIV